MPLWLTYDSGLKMWDCQDWKCLFWRSHINLNYRGWMCVITLQNMECNVGKLYSPSPSPASSCNWRAFPCKDMSMWTFSCTFLLVLCFTSMSLTQQTHMPVQAIFTEYPMHERYTYIHTHTHTHTHALMLARAHAHTHTHIQTQAQTHTQTNSHTYKHTHSHTHKHTY